MGYVLDIRLAGVGSPQRPTPNSLTNQVAFASQPGNTDIQFQIDQTKGLWTTLYTVDPYVVNVNLRFTPPFDGYQCEYGAQLDNRQVGFTGVRTFPAQPGSSDLQAFVTEIRTLVGSLFPSNAIIQESVAVSHP